MVGLIVGNRNETMFASGRSGFNGKRRELV
jgi:hypothetical protein